MLLAALCGLAVVAWADDAIDLWAGGPVPQPQDVPLLPSVTHVQVHRAVAGEYQFLHGPALVRHRGVWFAAWANSPVDENSADEIVRCRQSHDGGFTWQQPQVIAPHLDGPAAHTHGVFFEHDDQLWYFAIRFGDEHSQTEAFRYLDDTDQWESHGQLIPHFGPFSGPLTIGDGRWIMGDSAAVAIGSGEMPMTWQVHRIELPGEKQRRFPETAVWRGEAGIYALIRNPLEPTGLVSLSTDGGSTWPVAKLSNFPMAASKPFAGSLSTGQHYVIVNLDRQRHVLAIAVTRPHEDGFVRLWAIRSGEPRQPLYPGYAKSPQWSYPSAVEAEDGLRVIYSVGKEDCEMAIIPLDALKVLD